MPKQAKTTRRPEDEWTEMLTELVRGLWSYRYELVAIAVVLVAWETLTQPAGDIVASIVVVAVMAGLVAYPPTRRWLGHRFYLGRARRRWTLAMRDAGLESAKTGMVPSVVRAEKVAAGERLIVHVRRGGSVSDIESQDEVIAAALRVREVRVNRDPANAARAEVLLVKRDALASTTPLPWPLRDTAWCSIWDPIPVGVDEDGEVAWISLPERNVLIGGEPGAGKSAALSLLVATAAMDATTKLWLLDGKMVELAAWGPCAERSVGVSGEEAIEVLRHLQSEMEDRYTRLLDEGRRKVTRLEGLPLHVVVCDELAFYLTLSDRKQRTEFADVMRDLVSRGRAAGIIVIAATQKPSSDIIPTALRDLFGFRWAMRCNTPQASDTILGSGWASLGFTASQIPGASRGVGYLLAEGEEPVRLRAYYLDDYDVDQLAERAAHLRSLEQGPAATAEGSA